MQRHLSPAALTVANSVVIVAICLHLGTAAPQQQQQELPRPQLQQMLQGNHHQQLVADLLVRLEVAEVAVQDLTRKVHMLM